MYEVEHQKYHAAKIPTSVHLQCRSSAPDKLQSHSAQHARRLSIDGLAREISSHEFKIGICTQWKQSEPGKIDAYAFALHALQVHTLVEVKSICWISVSHRHTPESV